MGSPRVLGSGDGASGGIVEEVGILAQAAPEAKALAGIVALVDEVALGRVGSVALLQSQGGALPSLGLEAAVLAQAKLDALAEAAEEGGLVGGRPAEARSPPVAVDAGGSRSLPLWAEHIDVFLRHLKKRTPGAGLDILGKGGEDLPGGRGRRAKKNKRVGKMDARPTMASAGSKQPLETTAQDGRMKRERREML